MNELNEMGCHEFSDVAAELALGVLTGRERAQALAHLDHCASCREEVRQLTATGEGLLGLLPNVEPPAGFEARVMDRLGLAAPAPSPASRTGWTGGWPSWAASLLTRPRPARPGRPGEPGGRSPWRPSPWRSSRRAWAGGACGPAPRLQPGPR